LLHDIGKLGVSNSILDKLGKRDLDKWAAMPMHAAHTTTILSRLAAFSDLAAVAGAHHEGLDGKDYPRRADDRIVLETRIITTANIFDALTAERPYRAAMPLIKALAIMSTMIGTQLDAKCFTALERAMASIRVAVAAWCCDGGFAANRPNVCAFRLTP
jgi:HD-GYP domain-containing protein (c-di-GMP phosphodiesterase class II)